MNDRRNRWVNFICDPTRPARHLAGLGDTIGIQIEPIFDQALIDFIGRLTAKDSDPRTLVDALDYIFGGYHQFFASLLKHLLRGLSSENFREMETQGPAIKGKVNWPATLLSRSSNRLSEGRFIVRRPFKSFDLPENQLLRMLLFIAVADLDRLSRALGSGALLSSLADMRRLAEAGLRDFNLRTVTKVVRGSVEMMGRAHAHRDPAYREVARLVRRREMIIESFAVGRLESLLEMVRSGWLAPVSDDDLFELYTLALTLDVLAGECGLGNPSEYGLVVRGRSHIALFQQPDLKVTVYFDQTPAAIYGLGTRYAKVISCWSGVNGGERRPDIMIEFERNGFTHVLLVEIKRSDDDRYRRDSIYKVFGYLYDFSSLWKNNNVPKAALILPDRIEKRYQPPDDLPIRLVSGEDRAQLAEVFQEVISSL